MVVFMRLKAQLRRWQTAEIIDTATAQRIAAYEGSKQRFRFSTAMFGLGALAIVLGIAAVVASNWDAIPAAVKLLAHAVLNAGLAAGVLQAIRTERTTAREILLFLLAGATLTFIALIGQIYQTGAPLWQALALWLFIASPFLFVLTRAKFTVACWIMAFWTTLGAAADAVEHHLGPVHLDVAFYTLVPFLMIAVGAWKALRTRWPVWPALLVAGGYVLIAVAVSGAQLAWNDAFDYNVYEHRAHLFPAFFAALAAWGGLLGLRYTKYLEPTPLATSLFLLVSVLAGFLPLLMRHPHWPVVGAGIFMAYWALIGWTGLQLGYRGLLNASIVIIALRLVVIYVEVFGNLLSTGVGLIASGALLIAVVWATGKLIRWMGQSA
jgi:uncharacterized membrane protein